MTVYLVQDSKWVDPRSGQLKSKFDFSAASEYGDLVELLQPNASPFNLPHAIDQLQKGLETFSEGDFLLLVGSPVLIGLAVAIAAEFNNGDVGMLQWSGAKRCYIAIQAQNIFGDCRT